MTFDMFESPSLEATQLKLSQKMAALRSGFKSGLKPEDGAYSTLPKSIDGNIAHWLGVDSAVAADDLAAIRPTLGDIAKQLYEGVSLENGKQSLSLKEIHDWKINSEFKLQNENQHAGYAAEVIGTTKENLKAEMDGTGLKTVRADDFPGFKKNDQYVDKVRLDSSGNVVERVQVKFVGDDPKECLSKLTSKKYDKYFNDGKVDRIEVPKDYYDGIKKLIPEKLEGLKEQLKRVEAEGKTDVADGIKAKIERLNKIDDMIERSTVTKDEAVKAVRHPRRYVAKLFAENAFAKSHEAGLESAAVAASITAAVSTVDNTMKVMDGELSIEEALIDVAKDTGAAGGLAYGTTFVSTTVAQAMSASSHQLIRSLGNANVPAVVVSFGVQSFDSIVDFADGTIDAQQLVYDLGENAVQVGGSIAGSALVGAVVGSVVPGAGPIVGLVGGIVGCAVASEAYASVVEIGAEGADVLAEKVQEVANRTVDIAKDVVPEKVGNVVSSLNDFASANNLPFRV